MLFLKLFRQLIWLFGRLITSRLGAFNLASVSIEVIE